MSELFGQPREVLEPMIAELMEHDLIRMQHHTY